MGLVRYEFVMETKDIEALAQSVVKRWGWQYLAPWGLLVERARQGIERGLASHDPARSPLEAWLRKNARWAMSAESAWRHAEVRALDRAARAPRSVKAEQLTPRQRAEAVETRDGELESAAAWREAYEHWVAPVLSERQAMLVEDRLAGRTVGEIAAIDGTPTWYIERELEEIRALVERRRRSAAAERPWAVRYPRRPRLE